MSAIEPYDYNQEPERIHPQPVARPQPVQPSQPGPNSSDAELVQLVASGQLSREGLAQILATREFYRQQAENLIVQGQEQEAYHRWAHHHDALFGTDVAGQSAELEQRTRQASQQGFSSTLTGNIKKYFGL